MSSYNNKPGSFRFLLPFYLGYSYFRHSVTPEAAQRFLLPYCVSRTGKNLDPLPPNFVCSLRRPRSRWRSLLAPCASTSATAARGDTTTCTSWTRTSQAGRGSRAEARPATEENNSSNSSSSSFPAPAPLGPPAPRSCASSRRKTSDMSRVVFPVSALSGRRHVLASCCCCSCMIFFHLHCGNRASAHVSIKKKGGKDTVFVRDDTALHLLPAWNENIFPLENLFRFIVCCPDWYK